jgi:hypothetical protein
MAEELSLKPDDFVVDLQWPAASEAGGNAILDASIARFEMKSGSCCLTSFLMDAGPKSTALTVPAYYLVEWLTQNWWSFLYEPRKGGDSDTEADFRRRHWFGMPRNGIALPDVMFSPTGDTIEITAHSVYLRFAQLSFTEDCASIVRTDEVRTQFQAFISAVLAKMTERGVENSEAHQNWKRILDTSEGEEGYCRLMGSMGLSPYVEHPEIDRALDKISDTIAPSLLVDLCEAATLSSFKMAAEFTGRIADTLEKGTEFDIEPFAKNRSPPDSARKAYDWGYSAAAVARQAMGISQDDPAGRTEFFKKLGFDPAASPDLGSPVSSVFPIHGAMKRRDKGMKIAFSSGTDREFAAARSSFLAWVTDGNASRLVTTARTRQQRASRAFGAELLAPAGYLKKRLGKERDVSPFRLDKISNDIGVASTIVRWQAQNNGYRILDAA